MFQGLGPFFVMLTTLSVAAIASIPLIVIGIFTTIPLSLVVFWAAAVVAGFIWARRMLD